MVHKSTEKSEAKLMRRRPRGRSPSSPPRHSLATDDGASWSEGRAADDARRPFLDGHTVNRTEAAAVVATSHTATVMSRAAAARGCSRYVTAARHRARRGQYCAYWQQQCLAKLVRLPQAGPVAVGVTKIFVFRFFFLRSFVRFVGPLWLMPLKRYLDRL